MTAPDNTVDTDGLNGRQIQQAHGLLDREPSDFPDWPWANVAKLAGPLLPGDLWVVGARPGNGKTTFCLNALDNFVAHSLGNRAFPVLYMGTEMEPALLRVQWAAWRLGYPVHEVLEGNWAALPADARENIRWELDRMREPLYRRLAVFAPARRMTGDDVRAWVEYAHARGCRAIILDHIHRIRTGGDPGGLRLAIGESVRVLKELAVKHGLVVLVAAQLNRPAERSALADLSPPPVSAFKESGVLEEEADVALLLHRARRADVDAKEIAAVLKGERPVADVLEPHTMAVRIGKHRRRGFALDQVAFLHVGLDGKLDERAAVWREQGVEERYGL